MRTATKPSRPVFGSITIGRGQALVLPDGTLIPAELAALSVNETVLAGARQEIMPCLECGSECSVMELYRDSDVPGDCIECASGFFGCDLEGCPGDHHPDDMCDREVS